MSVTASIAAAFQAIAAAFNAVPWLAAWMANRDLERLKRRILHHESRNTPTDKRLADELRLFLPTRQRLHDALLTSLPGDSGRDRDSNITRAIPVADG